MRRDYEKRKQDANKRKLNVIGEQFVLDSQITTLNDQSNKQSDNRKEHDDAHKKQQFATDKKYKDTMQQRLGLEADCREGENKREKEMQDNFENKMVIYKDKTFTDLGSLRYDRDLKLNERYRDFKADELQKIRDEQAKVDAEYLGMAEL